MKYDYHVIVIGGGSAGLVVASGAASLGAKVLLVENNLMGGDCLNYGCVPSKAFLKVAHSVANINEISKFGVNATVEGVNLENVMEYVASKVQAIAPHDSIERYNGLGVEVITKTAVVKDGHHVEIDNKLYSAKNIVIASGSHPFIPNIKGLETIDYLTNKNIFSLKKLPKTLVVIGGGPIGLELGQGFKHLGSNVVIIDINSRLFINDDQEVSSFMQEKLMKDNITLLLSTKVIEVRKIADEIIVTYEKDGVVSEIYANEILVSAGRVPNTECVDGLNIDLDSRGFISTNAVMQTSIKSIFACGDVVGPYLFTHTAGYQATIITKKIIFGLNQKQDYSNIAWTTYTKPEVAHIGLTKAMATKQNIFFENIIVDMSRNDRAIANADEGFLSVLIDKKNRVIGVTLVCENAGDIISTASIFVQNKMKLSLFLNIMFAYPTTSQIFATAALDKTKENFTDFQKKLVKKLFVR